MRQLQPCRQALARASSALILTVFVAIQCIADEIPTTLRPSWPELVAYPADVPAWVSASQAFAADGKLHPAFFTPEARERLEFLLAQPKDPAKGCIVVTWIEQEYVNPPDRSTLARAVASSETIVWGKVVAADVGFERGDIGQLLMVQPLELLKPAGATPARVYFAFVPAGRLQVAESEICKEDPRAVVPAVGDEVLLLPHHAPAGETYLNLEYEGSLIVFGPHGETRLPRILSFEAKDKSKAPPAKAETLERVRSLAARSQP